jgi:hypothetical protein
LVSLLRVVGVGVGSGVVVVQVAVSEQLAVISRAIATATIPAGLRRASLSWR